MKIIFFCALLLSYTISYSQSYKVYRDGSPIYFSSVNTSITIGFMSAPDSNIRQEILQMDTSITVRAVFITARQYVPMNHTIHPYSR